MKKYSNKSRFIAAMVFSVIFLIIAESNAVVEFSSSLNPVGSGARATGLGGAFIGVADDATAASWNPAGLIQLEKPEISAVYSYFERNQTYSSPNHPEIAATNTMDTHGLNYASIVYPFVLLNRNMVISLNYQRLFEMDKNVVYMFNRVVPFLTDPDVPAVVDNTFVQEGYLYTLSPAMAVQLTPDLYIGGTLNFWDNATGRNGWDSTYTEIETAPVFGTTRISTLRQTQDNSFEGVNAHLGFMWRITDSLTLGGVYKTPFDADIRRKDTNVTDTVWPDFPASDTFGALNSSTVEFTMKMPDSYGLGLAYRHSDNWTVAFDIYRTEWSKFVLVDALGIESNPLDPTSSAGDRLKSTTQARLGTEYLFIRDKYAVPVRAGFFYDPEPNIGHVDDYYGFSVGTGYARGRVVVDMSYQFRTGNNVFADTPGIPGVTADIDQHTLMFSGILYFE